MIRNGTIIYVKSATSKCYNERFRIILFILYFFYYFIFSCNLHVMASRNQIISFDDNDKNTYAVDIYVTKLKAKIE